MKNLLKLLTPPIFILIYNKIFDHFEKKIFNNFCTALDNCKSFGYSDKLLVNHVKYSTEIYKKNLFLEKKISLNSFNSIIPLLIINNDKNQLNVVDFGGAAGIHYFNFDFIQKCFGKNMEISWNIIETHQMVDKSNNAYDNSLNFYKEIQSISSKFSFIDIVFSSSAIQYHPNPLCVLQELINLNAKYFFLTRTPLINSKTNLITIQKSNLKSNGPTIYHKGNDLNIYYPITYISRQKVEDLLLTKYDIVFKTKEGSGVFNFKNEKISMDGYFCKLKNS